MMQIVLFHSALGLRPAVRRFAEALAADGHTVHTPDLFDGEVFEKLSDGVAKRDAVGIPELSRRAEAAAADLPPDVVYMGFSMGAASAQHLALTRGARGAVLMHAALPVGLFGVSEWPTSVPCEVHAAEGDPWVDEGVISELAGSGVSVFRYTGGHLFADEGCPDYSEESAGLLLTRVQAFLGALA